MPLEVPMTHVRTDRRAPIRVMFPARSHVSYPMHSFNLGSAQTLEDQEQPSMATLHGLLKLGALVEYPTSEDLAFPSSRFCLTLMSESGNTSEIVCVACDPLKVSVAMRALYVG